MVTRGEYTKMPGKFTLLLCIPTIIHRSAEIRQLDIKSSSFYGHEMSLKQTWLRKNSQSLVYSIICSAPLFTLYLLAPFLATQSRSVTFYRALTKKRLIEICATWNELEAFKTIKSLAYENSRGKAVFAGYGITCRISYACQSPINNFQIPRELNDGDYRNFDIH